jgi:hypothetical protein
MAAFCYLDRLFVRCQVELNRPPVGIYPSALVVKSRIHLTADTPHRTNLHHLACFLLYFGAQSHL